MGEENKEKKEERQTEPFTFTLNVGNKAVEMRVELDQPGTALVLAANISVVCWPHVSGISVRRDTTGEFICQAPVMAVLQKIAPEVNRAAGQAVIPVINLASHKTIKDIADEQRKLRDGTQ